MRPPFGCRPGPAWRRFSYADLDQDEQERQTEEGPPLSACAGFFASALVPGLRKGGKTINRSARQQSLDQLLSSGSAGELHFAR